MTVIIDNLSIYHYIKFSKKKHLIFSHKSCHPSEDDEINYFGNAHVNNVTTEINNSYKKVNVTAGKINAAISKSLIKILENAAEHDQECPALRQSLNFVIKLKHEILVEKTMPVPEGAIAVPPTDEERVLNQTQFNYNIRTLKY